MKKVFTLLFTVPLILCTGCSNENTSLELPQTYKNDTPRKEFNDPGGLFFADLAIDENGEYIYPDSFAGVYLDEDDYVFLVTGNRYSEYQYLQDTFPNVKLEEAEYSLNYLQALADEYILTYDSKSETVFGSYVDVHENRAVVTVDEETLSRKTNYSDSPIVFKLGSSVYPF